MSRKCSQLSSMAIAKIYLTFWPWISPSGVVPFQNKEVGPFFGPWTNTGEWVYFTLWGHLRVSFAHETSMISKGLAMIVKKGYSVQSSTIFWVTLVVTSKNNAEFIDQAFCKTLSVCACFVREWNNEMTSQSQLGPFSWFVIHGPKMRPTSFLWKGTTLKENSRTYTFQSMDGVGTESQIPQLKKGAVWKS